MLKRRELKVAGWVAILSAVLTLPIAGISIVLETRSDNGPRLLSALLAVVNTALFVYLFTMLRALLVEWHGFHETTSLITALIVLNVAATGLDLLGAILPALDSAAGWLLGLAIVPVGLISVAFGIRLLRLRDSLFGLLKPFSYLYITTGLCYATILLIPVGVIGSAACDVILGIIFFRTAATIAPAR